MTPEQIDPALASTGVPPAPVVPAEPVEPPCPAEPVEPAWPAAPVEPPLPPEPGDMVLLELQPPAARATAAKDNEANPSTREMV
jgi:hypothetical protein